MQFYHIDPQYISELIKIAPHVYFSKETRPYIGVVLSVNGLDYFAPLSSPKSKHPALSKPVVFKITDLRDSNKSLGVIQLNNMIPVPPEKITRVEFKSLEVRYKYLLLTQYKFLIKNKEKIQDTAVELYTRATAGEPLAKICNDFKALESYYQQQFAVDKAS